MKHTSALEQLATLIFLRLFYIHFPVEKRIRSGGRGSFVELHQVVATGTPPDNLLPLLSVHHFDVSILIDLGSAHIRRFSGALSRAKEPLESLSPPEGSLRRQ